ncbi:hypothetical protein [Flavobacterium sp. GNP002]
MSNIIDNQKQALTNFLRNCFSKDEKYIIITDQIKGNRFALAEQKEDESYSTLSNFMKYEEMNCYFFGMKLMKDNPVKF